MFRKNSLQISKKNLSSSLPKKTQPMVTVDDLFRRLTSYSFRNHKWPRRHLVIFFRVLTRVVMILTLVLNFQFSLLWKYVKLTLQIGCHLLSFPNNRIRCVKTLATFTNKLLTEFSFCKHIMSVDKMFTQFIYHLVQTHRVSHRVAFLWMKW